uniref:PPM-type phosphatase domain-containing protein n=1 Tax=Ditylum brightwellii TaxID=49249 RepID=A0A7S2EEB9_9STRA|mmetsp:Transcript_25963/g.38630  ORF Transcript_25963/g.38630 Transcript_25963/m.38630 type:complete len:172 (+) Transcript_25963:449-964(+)
MGNKLHSPIDTKEAHVGQLHCATQNEQEQNDEDGTITYSISSMQGWRTSMEDSHLIDSSLYYPPLEERWKKQQQQQEQEEQHLNEIQKENHGHCFSSFVKHAIIKPLPPPNMHFLFSSSSPSSSHHHANTTPHVPIPNHAVFAIFDSHGGSDAATYASHSFTHLLCHTKEF